MDDWFNISVYLLPYRKLEEESSYLISIRLYLFYNPVFQIITMQYSTHSCVLNPSGLLTADRVIVVLIQPVTLSPDSDFYQNHSINMRCQLR
jgi:hypothetical protein